VSKKPFMDEMRKRRDMMRDAISRGQSAPVAMPAEANSFKAAPLREWAKGAGVDQNDPLLLRALEAQEKAVYPGNDQGDWKTNWTLWLDMEEAIQDFMEAHLEIKNAWPPNTQQIELLLRKVQGGEATAVEIEEFRRIADEPFRDWQPEYSPAFRERIEAALSLLR
jgi:hypothetical protein